MTTTDQIPALCLTCGTVRTVAASRMLYDGEPVQERLYRCATCGRGTLHGSAVGVPDARERANARAILRTDDPWAAVEARGWQVVEVPRLNDSACLVDGEQVVLVRHGLTEEHVRDIVQWALREIGGHQHPR